MRTLATVTVMPLPVPRLPIDTRVQLQIVIQRLIRQGFSTDDIRETCALIDTDAPGRTA